MKYTVSVKIITTEETHYVTAHSYESYDDCWRQIENIKKRIDKTATTQHIQSSCSRDKVSNELKQDAIFKSKMQIAVSNVVEEVMRSKS